MATPPSQVLSASFPWLDADWRLISLYPPLVILSFMWMVYFLTDNASMVDLGWPLSLGAVSTTNFLFGTGFFWRKLLLCSLWWLQFIRFALGWMSRKLWRREDKRFGLWRKFWTSGKGLLGRNIPFNFLVFYHAQSTMTAVSSFSLNISCNNPLPYLTNLEIFSVALWMFAIILENTADMQLAKFRVAARRDSSANKPKVLKAGLWKYSRHPNYFAEFILWCSYCLYGFSSVTETWHYAVLLLGPAAAYYFLVHYTGLPSFVSSLFFSFFF
jgi:steroid 5-alpha reductase family enzyme